MHLAGHEAPGAATLQVLRGRVRLVASDKRWELGEADHIQIPPTHRLESMKDAAILLTVATTRSG
jgi:quercetin dioxygenase-like cupin family protein